MFQFIGGVFALVAAHLAQSIFNWHNDSFVLRQRVNLFRESSKRDGSHKPPEALPIRGLWRMLRLIITIIILIASINSIKFTCIRDELCDHDVSHATHVFGALAGLLTGMIFLKVRSFKRPFYIFQNILFILLYGIALIWIFGRLYNALQNDYCPWVEYEEVCQRQCYRPDENHQFNNSVYNCTVNLCL